MASTITLTGDWLVNIGNRSQTSGTGNLGTYATNGVAVSANQVGLGVIDSLVIQPAGGYTFEYIASTGKVKAYYVAGSTPAGTISGTAAGQVFTGESYTPEGTVAAGVIPVTAGTTGDAVTNNAGVLESTGGQDLTVNAQAFTGTAHTLAGTNASSAITATFTGTAGSAGAQTEVANATNLAGTTFAFVAIGR